MGRKQEYIYCFSPCPINYRSLWYWGTQTIRSHTKNAFRGKVLTCGFGCGSGGFGCGRGGVGCGSGGVSVVVVVEVVVVVVVVVVAAVVVASVVDSAAVEAAEILRESSSVSP
jgi:hypothetical protein